MFRHAVNSWTRFVIARPVKILSVIALITLWAASIAVNQFKLDSDTGKLIQQDTHWKAVYNQFTDAFPQYLDNTFVVVSGENISEVGHISALVEAALKKKTEIFQRVYAPANDPFLESHSLYYLDTDDLDNMISNLASAQPFLSAIHRDPNLRGLFSLISDAVSGEEELPTSLSRIADLVSDSINAAIEGKSSPVAWRNEMIDSEPHLSRRYYNIIYVQGRQDFAVSLPNKQILSEIRSTIEQVRKSQVSQVEIRLSGQIPLDHGEIQSAMDSAKFAGGIASVLLVLILIFGVRSLRVIVATYIAMLIGLIWTAAFAMLSVGHYNTISIIFLVMFIGLGVDFAIHLSLRFQENLGYQNKQAALISSNTQLGPSIGLCGLSSAIGFLSFVPTEYTGLAELGIISGGGMIIAVFVSLTVIPAYFALVKNPRHIPENHQAPQLANWMDQNQKPIVVVTALIAIVALYIGKEAFFDYSTLSLKDPHSEAMTTLQELHEENVITDYALTYVAKNPENAKKLKQRLLQLPTVAEVKIPEDYVPSDQQEKSYLLDDAQFMLANTFYGPEKSTPYDESNRDQAIDQLITATTAYSHTRNSKLNQSIERLNKALIELAKSNTYTKVEFEKNVIEPALNEMSWLKAALSASPFSFSGLPQPLRDRLISKDGAALITITAKKDIVPVAAMREFTQQVQSIVPDATGRPILDLGIGDIVVTAFQQAIALSLVCILIILVLSLQSLIDAILVFVPLLLTAVIVLATTVLIDLPLNMANVVVIPLIFGLGVDNGIHIVERFHEATDMEQLMQSSTPRAVLLSTLTTLGTFGALSFSTHQGIYSIGILLTFALSALMLLTLISLPALLAVFSESRALTIESLQAA